MVPTSERWRLTDISSIRTPQISSIYQRAFTRLKTLGVDYTEEALAARIAGRSRPSRQPKQQNGKISLLIDIQNNIKAQQSAGFTHWAKLNNLKQAAKTMNFLTEHGISSYGELESKLTAISARRDTAHAEIKRIESRSAELALVMKHAGTYRQLDCHAENHRTGYADQQVRGMKTEPRGGKGCREAVPDGKQLAGEVSTGRKPERLCHLIEGIHKQKIRKIQQNSFSCSSLHAPIFDLYFLPVNGAVFRFLRRLFLRLGQPFQDGGLFLTAYFPAGKLLKCRCDGIRIPAFEKDQVTGLLCGGVFLQAKSTWYFFATWEKALIFLSLISILARPAF